MSVVNLFDAKGRIRRTIFPSVEDMRDFLVKDLAEAAEDEQSLELFQLLCSKHAVLQLAREQLKEQQPDGTEQLGESWDELNAQVDDLLSGIGSLGDAGSSIVNVFKGICTVIPGINSKLSDALFLAVREIEYEAEMLSFADLTDLVENQDEMVGRAILFYQNHAGKTFSCEVTVNPVEGAFNLVSVKVAVALHDILGLPGDFLKHLYEGVQGVQDRKNVFKVVIPEGNFTLSAEKVLKYAAVLYRDKCKDQQDAGDSEE